jgi:hypothetical protein
VHRSEDSENAHGEPQGSEASSLSSGGGSGGGGGGFGAQLRAGGAAIFAAAGAGTPALASATQLGGKVRWLLASSPPRPPPVLRNGQEGPFNGQNGVGRRVS